MTTASRPESHVHSCAYTRTLQSVVNTAVDALRYTKDKDALLGTIAVEPETAASESQTRIPSTVLRGYVKSKDRRRIALAMLGTRRKKA